jgi:hypothetical protein
MSDPSAGRYLLVAAFAFVMVGAFEIGRLEAERWRRRVEARVNLDDFRSLSLRDRIRYGRIRNEMPRWVLRTYRIGFAATGVLFLVLALIKALST